MKYWQHFCHYNTKNIIILLKDIFVYSIGMTFIKFKENVSYKLYFHKLKPGENSTFDINVSQTM